MTRVLGIDPGASGALAWIEDERCVSLQDMPLEDKKVDGRELKRLIEHFAPVDFVVIEKVHSMPNQGVSSTFKFGMAYGAALAVVQSLGYEIIDVPPQTWKKYFQLTGKEKTASIELALQKWPDTKDKLYRKKDHGRADAALIALWGMENYDGNADRVSGFA